MLQAQGLLVTFLPLTQLAIPNNPRRRELTRDVLYDCGACLAHSLCSGP